MRLTRTVAGDKVTVQVLPPAELSAPVWERWLRHVAEHEGGVLGCDVETTAIDDDLGPFEPAARLRLVQFGSRRYAWALDPHDLAWRPRIAELLASFDLDGGFRFVTHTNYDPLWAHREFSTPVDERWIDTHTLACLVHPGNEPKGLKELTSRYLDDGLKDAEAALLARFKELAPTGQRAGLSAPKAWGFTNIPLDDEVFAAYGGLDAIYVRRLLDELNARVKAKRMSSLSRREQQIQRISTNVRIRGQRVDGVWARELLAEIETEYNGADERLATVFGFSPRSPKRGPWLAEHGAQFTEFTPTGAPKITMPSAASRGTLPTLAERYEHDEVLGPIFADLLTLGTHKNMLTNLKIILKAASVDGFVHPQIRTQAAHTGRMSIVKPAMQTFKKRDPRLRGCFVARPGMVLVGADYDSQEIRIAAALSRDKELLRIVREGLNQHVETAKMIFGAAYVDKSSVAEKATGRTYYDQAKVLDFAQQYGAGPRTIGDQLGMPRSREVDDRGVPLANPRARELWQAWRNAYSGLVQWTEEVGALRELTNPHGRVIPADPWRGYASGNYLIQSTGRDVLGAAIVKLHESGWGESIWLYIHDELVLEVWEDEAEDACAALEAAMFTKVNGIPLTATAKVIGSRWGADND